VKCMFSSGKLTTSVVYSNKQSLDDGDHDDHDADDKA